MTLTPTLTSDLDLNPMRAMIMAHTHANGQRSLGSKVRMKADRRTDGRAEAIALPPVLMRSVISE